MAPPTLPPPRRFLTVVLVSVAAFSILFRGAGARETRFPIQVAQDGTAVEFVYDSAKDDLAASVINFCAKHLPGADVKDCSENLLDQVGAYDDFREESLQLLPSLSFAVNTGAAGQQEKKEELRFAHVVGNNPADEAEAFCGLHFPLAPLQACVNQMLENMEQAMHEVADHEMLMSRLSNGPNE
jgi:hypothetical protein